MAIVGAVLRPETQHAAGSVRCLKKPWPLNGTVNSAVMLQSDGRPPAVFPKGTAALQAHQLVAGIADNARAIDAIRTATRLDASLASDSPLPLYDHMVPRGLQTGTVIRVASCQRRSARHTPHTR